MDAAPVFMKLSTRAVLRGRKDMADSLREWIENNLNSMDANIQKIIQILTINFMVDNDPWYAVAIEIKTIIEPIALTIVVICFLVEFLKITIQMDILKWEYGLKVMFKFVFAKVCIEGAFDLLGAIFVTSMEWISSVGATGASVGADTWNAIMPIVSNYNMFQMLGVAMSLGIMFLAVWAVSLAVQVMAYARKFEITIYLAIAPLPCAFLPLEDGGASRIPKKYIFTFASVCLQGVFMVMSVRLFNVLCTESIDNAIQQGQYLGGIVGELFIGVCVLLMAIVKSSSWAKSILDV